MERKWNLFLFLVCLLSLPSTQTTNEFCLPNVLHGLQGDFYISVLLPLRTGPSCSDVDSNGVELMESAKWALQRLNKEKYFNDKTVGIIFHNSCQQASFKRIVLDAMMSGGFLQDKKCSSQSNVALLIADPFLKGVSPFLQELSIPHVFIPEPRIAPNVEAVLSLLLRLNWTKVAVFGSSNELKENLNDMSADIDVCLITSESLQNANGSELHSIPTFDGFVLVGMTTDIIQFWKEVLLNVSFRTRVIFVPYDQETHQFAGLPLGSEMYVIKRINSYVPEFGTYYATSFLRAKSQNYSQEDLVEGRQVFEMMKTVFGVLSVFRQDSMEDCLHNTTCTFDQKQMQRMSRPKLEDIKRYMNIHPEQPRFQILYQNTNNSFFRKIGFYYGGALSLSEDLPYKERNQEEDVLQCIMERKSPLLQSFKLREDKWIIVFSTITVTGCCVVILIGIFILVYACLTKSVEGSLGFTFLLLLSVFLLFSSFFTFCFEPFPLLCEVRYFWTSSAYAFLFACLLSRSLMIATADTKGSIGHVSGVVQTSLIFFTSFVQIGIGLSQWNTETTSDFPDDTTVVCEESGIVTLYYLSYVKLLLFLQFLVAPFTLKSKRNHREGLFYFAVTLFLVVIWCAWVTIFVLFSEHRDFTIASGIVVSAMVFLLIIIIPKSYLMLLEEVPSLPPVPSLIRSKHPYDSSSIAFFNSLPPTGVNYMVPLTSNYVYENPPTIIEQDRDCYASQDLPSNLYFHPSPSKVSHI